MGDGPQLDTPFGNSHWKSDKPMESEPDALMDIVMLKLLSVPEFDRPMESHSDALIGIVM